jgi:hypothetical protein
MNGSNNAPKTQWFKQVMACGTERQRLYVDGRETPFFIDTAQVAAHKTYGERHGLWGAGMSEPHWRTQNRIAACLGCGPKITPLKARAERMALSD